MGTTARLRFEQMRNFLMIISACAKDVLEAMDDIERLAARDEERNGPPAVLLLMPNRKDVVQ